MSVVIELSPLETALMVITGRGDEILWTDADVKEHYRQKRLDAKAERAEQKANQTSTRVGSAEIISNSKIGDESYKAWMAEENATTKSSSKKDSPNSRPNITSKQSFLTIFKSEELLKQVLLDLKIDFLDDKASLQAKLDGCTLIFKKNNDGVYVVKFSGVLNSDYLYEQMGLIDKQYKKSLQQSTKKSVMKNLSKNGMKFLKEEVLEDNSIVLTIFAGNINAR